MATVLLDLNGTLLDPGPAGPDIRAAVRLAIVHGMAGEYRPLGELIEAVGGEVPAAMPPFPDVTPGLERLRAAGHAPVVLTNSARATAEAHLEGAGIRGRLDAVIGTDELGVHKPGRGAYLGALARLGADPADAWMVAAHDWDVVGAHLAGLRTAYLDRGGPRPVSIRVDREAGALDELEL
jgi:2-haloacid dehalogenase